MYISLEKLQESTLGMIVFLIVGKRWGVTKVSNQSGNEELCPLWSIELSFTMKSNQASLAKGGKDYYLLIFKIQVSLYSWIVSMIFDNESAKKQELPSSLLHLWSLSVLLCFHFVYLMKYWEKGTMVDLEELVYVYTNLEMNFI